MEQSIIDAFNTMLGLTGEQCNVVGLKLLGNSEKGFSEVAIYQFMGIVKAETDLPDTHPTPNDIVLLQNNRKDLSGGASIDYIAKWKKEAEGKKRTVSFEIRGLLNAQNILDWEIVDGAFYIKMQLIGSFS